MSGHEYVTKEIILLFDKLSKALHKVFDMVSKIFAKTQPEVSHTNSLLHLPENKHCKTYCMEHA